MITVTQNAVRHLRTLLEGQPESTDKGLRVQINKGGCSGLHYEMTLDRQKSGDAIVESDGVKFLIDNESASYLQGATLDYRDELSAAGFQIVNPNAARTCGCGTSFEIAQQTPVQLGP
jgi:iron-sulfur cluster assembly accessory protein